MESVYIYECLLVCVSWLWRQDGRERKASHAAAGVNIHPCYEPNEVKRMKKPKTGYCISMNGVKQSI